MKKLLMLAIFVLSFGVIILIQSCNEKSPSEPEPTPPEVIIPNTTKTIDSTDYNADLVSISNDTSIFTFQSDFRSKYDPAVNDILVITKSPGMLRKITNVQISGNNIILTTKQATLIEAIEKGKISLRQSLQKGQIRKIDYYYDGIRYHLNKGEESNFFFDIDIVLFDADSDSSTTNDQVRLVGDFILTADIIFEAEISSFKLQTAKIGLDAQNSEDLELIAGLNYTLQKNITLATVHMAPIYYQLGPLPVIILIRLDIIAGLDGYANASMTIGFENSINYDAGIKYAIGQGWSTYKESDNQNSFSQPTLTGNVGSVAFVKPEISLAVYGVLAGYANASAYGEILANTNNIPWWQLNAGLDFNVGTRARIWGIQIFDYEANVLELRWLLAQAPTGGNPPQPPTLLSPVNGTTNVSIPPTLRWNASSGATSYSLQVATDDLFSNLVYNQSGLTSTSQQVQGLNYNTTYYWRVNASNSFGISDWSSAWDFATATGYSNLVQNADFENDLNFWDPLQFPSGWSTSSNNPQSGQKCGFFDFPNGAGYYDASIKSTGYQILIASGETYYFSFWIREKDTHDTYDIDKTILDPGVNVNGHWFPAPTPIPSESWQFIDTTITFTETGNAEIHFQLHGYATTSQSEFAIDNVVFVKLE